MVGEKLEKLKGILHQMRSVLVAFSGGCDSAFLLAVAKATLKERVIAVTAFSAAMPQSEIRQAVSLAKKLGVKHLVVNYMPPKGFWSNSAKRCYFCKKDLFTKFKRVAARRKLRYVVDGTNTDDANDFRPGTKALQELGIRSPLAEAGLRKQGIKNLSNKIGLLTWKKPAVSCLATRISFAEEITPEKLAMVAKAEKFIRGLGFLEVRVRMHCNIARIEVAPKNIPELARMREKISRKLKALGFLYVTVDCDGYRTGSMNEELIWKRKK